MSMIIYNCLKEERKILEHAQRFNQVLYSKPVLTVRIERCCVSEITTASPKSLMHTPLTL